MQQYFAVADVQNGNPCYLKGTISQIDSFNKTPGQGKQVVVVRNRRSNLFKLEFLKIIFTNVVRGV